MPYVFMDPTNFFPANPMKTPPHIQPEWYFLFAYRVLRAVPNKAGGIVALVLSVVILFFVPFLHWGKFRGLAFYPCCRVFFWCFVCNFMFLTWVGRIDVKEPFIFAGQVRTCIYFGYFVLAPILMVVEDRLFNPRRFGFLFRRIVGSERGRIAVNYKSTLVNSVLRRFFKRTEK